MNFEAFWLDGVILSMFFVISVPAFATMGMEGMYGPYSMTHEASGTSWEPDATPHEGIHFASDHWMYMLHGFANVGYDDQGGNRGDRQGFTTNMLMFSGQRQFESDTIGFRTMTSLEPIMGPNGYAELLQTGETGNGVLPLIDRQHPHDFLMELALTESHQLTDNSSAFLYGGLPGEPALGPTAFMHRLSAEDNPMAPIGHHWMDSTHITYGVLTTGYIWRDFKLEGSFFRGREPNQDHWEVEETPKLDSYSGRLSYNPSPNWSAQMSMGHLTSPEQLFPSNNTNRATASVSYTRTWLDGWSATTLAWGRNWQEGIDTLDAGLIESALNIERVHTFFTRLEYVQKDDLVPATTLSSIVGFGRTDDYHPFFPPGTNSLFSLNIFGVEQFTLGYIYDFAEGNYVTWGIGGSGSISFVPDALDPFYGGTSLLSYALFVRAKLGRGTETRNLGRNEKTSAPTPAQVPTPLAPVPSLSTIPKISQAQLSAFFDRCKPGTTIQISLRNGKTEIATFESYDFITETVWFYNPQGSFFRTRAVHLDSILSAQVVQGH